MNRRQFVVAAATLPLLARDPIALAARVGGLPLALVTADAEAHVVAVRLADGRVHSRIETLAGPRSIQAVGNQAVVAHTAAGAVSIVDGAQLRVRHVIEGFAEPRYTAGSPDGRLAYVTDSGSGEVVVVDVGAGRILGRTTVYGPARHVTIGPSGRTLWAALGSSALRIAILSLRDPRRPTLARFVEPPFLAHDVAHDGRRLWVSSGDDHHETVLVCEAGTGRVLRRLAGGATPQHVTFAGRRAHVSSGADGTLRVYSLEDGRLLHTSRLPRGSYNVQAAEGLVLSPSLTRGTLCIVDALGRRLSERRVATSSHDACLVVAA